MMVIMRQIAKMEQKEKAVKGCPGSTRLAGNVGHESEDSDSVETAAREKLITDSVARLGREDDARARAAAAYTNTPTTARTEGVDNRVLQEDGSEDSDSIETAATQKLIANSITRLRREDEATASAEHTRNTFALPSSLVP